MAHIQRRFTRYGEVRWQVRVSVKTGGERKYLAKEFATKREALAWERDQGALVERRQVSGGEASFSAFIERWLVWLEGQGKVEKKTLAEYKAHLQRVLREIGDKPIGRLTPIDFDNLWITLLRRGGREGRPLSRSTIHHVAAICSNALARAERWNLIAANPVARSEPPAADRSPMRAPTTAEAQALLDHAAGGPWHLLILLTLLTGLRRGEALALGWHNLDLEQATLTVTRTAWEVGGEYGLKQRAKTKSSLRTIAIPAILVEELRAHKAKQNEERLAFGKYYRVDLALVFTRPGGVMIIPSNATKAVSQIARAAGVPREVAPLHGLRHGHATNLLASGISLKVASARLGHSSIRFTADAYMHVGQELDRTAAAAMDSLFRPMVRK